MFRRTFLAASAAALLPTLSWGRQAQAAGATAVDLALILAVDASMSIDESEAGTQRAGYIHALRDKRIGDAIKGGPIGRIALTYMEWSSPYHQTVIIPWRILKDGGDAKKFADELDATPYKSGSTTSISGGIDFAVKLFKSPEFEPARKVIDVSGDGYSDYGRPVTVARDAAVAAGITINGLPVMNERPKWKQSAPADLDTYYRDNVIGGPGSFFLAVRNLEDFSRSVLQKMVLEIAGLEPPPRTAG
jgi:hypothetical protein